MPEQGKLRLTKIAIKNKSESAIKNANNRNNRKVPETEGA